MLIEYFSIMSDQITPGQRCLLEISQRKLIETLQLYARLSQERDEFSQTIDDSNKESCASYDLKLSRLREKIKKISERQKRYTREIIYGNRNNPTIPKESFLKALGLVTKDTLRQVESKPHERRRRSTANPLYSHEAIQAKRAVQEYLRNQQNNIKSRL